MVSETEKKTAFRIAYDAITARKEPQFTAEYFDGVTSEFTSLIEANKGNRLLPCLLIGVYKYLEEEARLASTEGGKT